MKVKSYKLEDVCHIQIGKTPRREVSDYWGKGYNWVSISDMKSKVVSKTKEEITEKGFNECGCKLIPKGTVLLSFKLSIGKVAFAGADLVTNEAIAALQIKNSEVLKPEYLFYVLKHIPLTGSNNAAMGSTLNKESLRGLRLPIPESIDDQIHIANILSDAEALIAQRKESIRLLDELLKSTFLEMFGDPVKNEKNWESYNGEEYCEKLTVGVVVKPASYYVEEGVIALRSLNIKPNRIELNNLVYFSASFHQNELSKSILRAGDVVIVRTGSTGTAAVIPEYLDGVNCIDLIITRPKTGLVNPVYLAFFFNSEFGKRLVASKEVGGIQKHFNIGTLKHLAVPCPPIQIQEKFAHIVEQANAQKTLYQQSLKELENLYGSLSQKAFKGELIHSKNKIPVVKLI